MTESGMVNDTQPGGYRPHLGLLGGGVRRLQDGHGVLIHLSLEDGKHEEEEEEEEEHGVIGHS